MHVLNTPLIRQADCYLDDDDRRDTFVGLGNDLFGRFRSDKGKISAQVRNLQQIACSATRFADIEDFVKNQMGKEKEKGDSKWKAVGHEVLQQLSHLRIDSREMDHDHKNRMALRLYLARGWVRAVVGQYLYRVALDRMDKPA